MISINLGQDDCDDLRNYHYYNAFSFFHYSRSHDIDVAGLQGFLNPVLDFPYYLLTVVFPRSPRTVAFFMGLPFGLLAYFWLLTWIRLFAGRPYGWLAALLALIFGLSGASTFSQLGLSTNEVLTGSDAAYEAVIPPVAGYTHLTLRFHILNPASPSELHLSNDARELGIGLEQLMVQVKSARLTKQ